MEQQLTLHAMVIVMAQLLLPLQAELQTIVITGRQEALPAMVRQMSPPFVPEHIPAQSLTQIVVLLLSIPFLPSHPF